MNYYLYGSLILLYFISVLLTAIYNHTFDHTHFTGHLDGSVEGSEEGHRNKKFAPIKHKSTSFQNAVDLDTGTTKTQLRQNHQDQDQTNNNINHSNTSRIKRKLKSTTESSSSSSSSCQKKYPETCNIYPYIKYWTHEFSTRDCYISPTKLEQHDLLHTSPHTNTNKGDRKEHKYVVFRHDSGGWNNIRVAFESIVVYAIASGRTLVLPPKEIWAWLRANPNPDDNLSDFNSFVNLNKLEGILHIISMEEFLELTAHKGLLKIRPPENVMEIKEAGAYSEDKMHLILWKYLYESCYVFHDFEPADVFFEFALRYDPNSKQILYGHIVESTVRFEAFLEHRKRTPYFYNASIHDEVAIFFPASHRDGTYREVGLFYRYIYFEDPNVDAAMKRIIRDRTHYNDDIMCAAGKVAACAL